jgi:hypothetical protein
MGAGREKGGREHALEPWCDRWQGTGSIVVDASYPFCLMEEISVEFLVQYFLDLLIRLVDRVDALRGGRGDGLPALGEAPVGFCAAAVGYQYLHAKEAFFFSKIQPIGG